MATCCHPLGAEILEPDGGSRLAAHHFKVHGLPSRKPIPPVSTLPVVAEIDSETTLSQPIDGAKKGP